MTNYEYYQDELNKLTIANNSNIRADLCNFIQHIGNTDICRQDISCSLCGRLFALWLVQEYHSLEKLEMDAPIWVKNFNEPCYHKRHFAGFEGHKIKTWIDGYTSHTISDPKNWTTWDEYSTTDPIFKIHPQENEGEKQ